jgi:hypothetical protein
MYEGVAAGAGLEYGAVVRSLRVPGVIEAIGMAVGFVLRSEMGKVGSAEPGPAPATVVGTGGTTDAGTPALLGAWRAW